MTNSPFDDGCSALPPTAAAPTASLAPDVARDLPRRRVAPSARRVREIDLMLDAQAEMKILEAIKANLTVHHEMLEDPELMMVLAEGQTSLLELIDILLEYDLLDDGVIEGLKRSKDTMVVRLSRLEQRRQSRRSIIEQVMFLIERKSLERPVATITLSDRSPSLVVEEEAQIPARFFDLKPVLSRRLLKEALDAGEEVAGARLSSGVITLTVRRR